jgi:hypothetical protein
MQQQNYSLAALDDRDANGPFDKPPAPTPPPSNDGGSPSGNPPGTPPDDPNAPPNETDTQRAARWLDRLLEGLNHEGVTDA